MKKGYHRDFYGAPQMKPGDVEQACYVSLSWAHRAIGRARVMGFIVGLLVGIAYHLAV